MSPTSSAPSELAAATGPTEVSGVVPPDPRGVWRGTRARLGGHLEPVAFTATQSAVLEAAADRIIPPGGGFPAPSAVGIVEFIGRYVTPEGQPITHYPLAGETDFKAHVDAIGTEFLAANENEQVEILRRLEKSESEFFEQLKGLVYYGYYSRPQVVQAIRENLPAGRDYHGPPQPYGYLESIEHWDPATFPTGRGAFIPTDAVRPVAVPSDIEQEDKA